MPDNKAAHVGGGEQLKILITPAYSSVTNRKGRTELTSYLIL
jgi:hypothetical protein